MRVRALSGRTTPNGPATPSRPRHTRCPSHRANQRAWGISQFTNNQQPTQDQRGVTTATVWRPGGSISKIRRSVGIPSAEGYVMMSSVVQRGKVTRSCSAHLRDFASWAAWPELNSKGASLLSILPVQCLVTSVEMPLGDEVPDELTRKAFHQRAARRNVRLSQNGGSSSGSGCGINATGLNHSSVTDCCGQQPDGPKNTVAAHSSRHTTPKSNTIKNSTSTASECVLSAGTWLMHCSHAAFSSGRCSSGSNGSEHATSIKTTTTFSTNPSSTPVCND